jgi:hypothetical protein
VCTDSCQISGFAGDDQVLVVVNKSGGGVLAGRVRLASDANLTDVSGYATDPTNASGYTELGFQGTQAQVNAALATLQYKGPAGGGQESIGISATLGGAAYFSGTGHYYEIVTTPLTWAAAKTAAEGRTFNGLNGYLATILSDEENRFIDSKITERSVWIGGEYNASTGRWGWVTGPASDRVSFWTGRTTSGSAIDGVFVQWETGQPDGSATCLSTNYDGGDDDLLGNWDDLDCERPKSYIVEYGGNGGTVAKQASVTFAVAAPTAPLQVTGLTATAGSTEVALSWTAPGNGGSAITDYVIEQSSNNGSSWTTVADGTSTATSYTVTGLTNGTAYVFRVSAKNIVGTGTASSTVSATPNPSVNLPAGGANAFTGGFKNIGSGSTIVGYTENVRVVITSSRSTGELRLGAVTGLTRVQGYDNSSSISAAGDSIAYEGTPAAAQTALQSLQYRGSTAATDTITVEVSPAGFVGWTNTSGGVTRYHYYRAVTGSRDWTTARAHAQEPVALGGANRVGWLATIASRDENLFVSQYVNADAWMGAHDTAVEGTWVWVSEAGDGTANGHFWTGLSNGSVQNSLFANWATGEPNDSSSREDAGQFYASRQDADGAEWNDLPATGTSLSAYIWEFASTTQLFSPRTETMSVVVAVPDSADAVTGLSATLGIGNIALSWTAPADTGDFDLTDYVVQFSSNNGSSWSTFSDGTSTSTTATVTGLVAGTSYVFRVIPVTFGQGTASAATASVTIPSAPLAPQTLVGSALDTGASIVFQAPTSDGGRAITNYQYSLNDGSTWTAVNPVSTSTTITISGLVNGQSYTIRVRAINAVGNGTASSSVVVVPAVPPTPPAPASGPSALPAPPAVVQPPRVLPQVLSSPPPVVGPVVQNGGGGSLPPSQPTALVGGRPLAIQSQVTDPNTMSLRAGVLNIGMNVASGQGGVSSQGGSTELQVRNGGSAGLTGSGLLPRSTVQVFMPGLGSNSREIARIPVDANGSFSGDAIFGATPSERPLPIGRQVLQMVTVDENRQQTVVEMTINIAQPPPAPEFNRSTNERPALLPGQSIATNGGQPEPVTVTPIPDQKQATIQGDGWSMAVGVEGDGGGVASGEGGAVVTFVRDQGAVVSGEGFMPGTRADVFLFSDPTLLGTVEIDSNGEFNGTVNIDGNVVTVGEHTLQLQGVGEDGYVRSANLGVTVADEAPALTEETSGSFLWLLLAALGVVGAAAAGTWWYRRALR